MKNQKAVPEAILGRGINYQSEELIESLKWADKAGLGLVEVADCLSLATRLDWSGKTGPFVDFLSTVEAITSKVDDLEVELRNAYCKLLAEVGVVELAS